MTTATAEMASIAGHTRIRLGGHWGWWISLQDLRINAKLVTEEDGLRAVSTITVDDELEEGLWIEWRDVIYPKRVLELFLWRPADQAYFCIEPGEETP